MMASVFISDSTKSPETKARRQLIRILKESLIPHSASETRWRENLGPGGGGSHIQAEIGKCS